MKRTISIMLLILFTVLLIFSTSGCSGTYDGKEYSTRINFGTKIEELKKLNDKKVSIIGFMTTYYPINKRIDYLCNTPIQTKPFTADNSSELIDTIAFKTDEDFELTDKLIKITGNLQIINCSDSYGFTYSYRIQNAVIEEVDPDNMYGNAEIAANIANANGALDLINGYLACDDLIYHDVYETDIANTEKPADFGYDDIKSKITKLNGSGKYDEYLSLLNRVENMRESICKMFDDANGNIFTLKNSLKTLQKTSDQMYTDLIAYFNSLNI